LSRLQHPAIVRYVAQGVVETGHAYLAMEWLEGETLSARLQRGAQSVEETLELAQRIASALAYAHGESIIHRDIKPSNLFLVDGQIEGVRVIDFGIARGIRFSTDITRTGVLVGTPGYIAPEQARASKTIDARVDIFSLGCVLFKCLTGLNA